MRSIRHVLGVLALASTVTFAAGCSSSHQRSPVWYPTASRGGGEGRTTVRAAKPKRENRGNRGQQGRGNGNGKKNNGNGHGHGKGRGNS